MKAPRLCLLAALLASCAGSPPAPPDASPFSGKLLLQPPGSWAEEARSLLRGARSFRSSTGEVLQWTFSEAVSEKDAALELRFAREKMERLLERQLDPYYGETGKSELCGPREGRLEEGPWGFRLRFELAATDKLLLECHSRGLIRRRASVSLLFCRRHATLSEVRFFYPPESAARQDPVAACP